MSDLLKAVGLTDVGDNHKTAKRAIKEMGLNTSHFISDNKSGSRRATPEEMFIENSSVHRSTIKKHILRNNLFEYCCARCSNPGEWLGQPMTLDLDHINGINNDHRLENLRFLCPNCHSLTPTHRGKRT
jgi:5-methylcytosine-specific restriction endonuclease McrA